MNFNLGPGDSIPKVQNITVTTDSIRPCIHENIAKPGDVMYHYYKENDYPPKSKGNMLKYDTFGPENTIIFQ